VQEGDISCYSWSIGAQHDHTDKEQNKGNNNR
jgi:hypothetical protein